MLNDDSYLTDGFDDQCTSSNENFASASDYISSAADGPSLIRNNGEIESIEQTKPFTDKTPSENTTQWSEDFSSFHLFRSNNASLGKTIIEEFYLWALGPITGPLAYQSMLQDHAESWAKKPLASVSDTSTVS